ncbi:MAG: hypothetical protein ACR2PT_21780 [Endozoicomonas sp.]
MLGNTNALQKENGSIKFDTPRDMPPEKNKSTGTWAGYSSITALSEVALYVVGGSVSWALATGVTAANSLLGLPVVVTGAVLLTYFRHKSQFYENAHQQAQKDFSQLAEASEKVTSSNKLLMDENKEIELQRGKEQKLIVECEQHKARTVALNEQIFTLSSERKKKKSRIINLENKIEELNDDLAGAKRELVGIANLKLSHMKKLRESERVISEFKSEVAAYESIQTREKKINEELEDKQFELDEKTIELEGKDKDLDSALKEIGLLRRKLEQKTQIQDQATQTDMMTSAVLGEKVRGAKVASTRTSSGAHPKSRVLFEKNKRRRLVVPKCSLRTHELARRKKAHGPTYLTTAEGCLSFLHNDRNYRSGKRAIVPRTPETYAGSKGGVHIDRNAGSDFLVSKYSSI